MTEKVSKNEPTTNRNPQNSRTNSQNSRGKSLKERLANIKTTRWIRFALVSMVFFLWVIWMGNPWLLFLWLILIDIYITSFIPWTWWKGTKGATRMVWGWVDAIIYALILVYIIFAFIGQNYMIPSSSLEKSLLVGDYLWVNKALYGPRVPQTPLHFPLEQHTMPIINTKSYIEHPQLPYHRLPGLRQIQRGDIVVFNYPQGDTVALKIQNPDYYQISYDLKKNGVENPKAYIEANPDLFGEIVYRPVDRRENYVKRAIGLPGERLKIMGDTVYINGEPIAEPTNVQFNYIIPVKATIPAMRWEEIGVSRDDYSGALSLDESTGTYFYDLPLTYEMKSKVEKWPEVNGEILTEAQTGRFDLSSGIFPLGNTYGWSRPDIAEFWIPQRGSTLHLTLDNLPIYERAIRVYEGNKLEVKDGKIYINGEPTDYYTFKMDYYWMMGDNRDRSADSRYWGFVPEDHIVGTPMFVFASFDKDKGLFDGKVRWERILRSANPDQGKW
ncbi:MAG: S26 family signal peptidase [Muribaculaceae bacterium]|nr:S26 family signal peptidase [Muribaculaceae bacterium]